MSDQTVTSDADVLALAVALQKAAILLRDIASSLPLRLQATMPPDIGNRLYSIEYQSVIDSLPPSLHEQIQAVVQQDPDIIEARRIHRDAHG